MSFRRRAFFYCFLFFLGLFTASCATVKPGLPLRKEKDFEKAVTAFRKALSIRSDDEGLYYNLSRSYIESGDWKSAKSAMEEGIKINPDFDEGIRLMAFIQRNDPQATDH